MRQTIEWPIRTQVSAQSSWDKKNDRWHSTINEFTHASSQSENFQSRGLCRFKILRDKITTNSRKHTKLQINHQSVARKNTSQSFSGCLGG